MYYISKKESQKLLIFLMFDRSHYNYITRLTDAFKTVNNIKCNLCGMKGIIHNDKNVICNECHLTFKGTESYNEHKTEKCNQMWKCTQWKKTITGRKNEHTIYVEKSFVKIVKRIHHQIINVI